MLVSSFTIASIILSLVVAVGIPIVLLIIFKKNFNISIKVVLFGMLTFFVFASILEGFFHAIFLEWNKSTKALLENTWLYMLYGGLMAGIFEETGRFIMIKYALKKYREWKDGLAFGLGHGGIESILIVGINSVVMVVLAFMINNGSYDSFIKGQAATALAPLYEQLTGSSSYLMLFAGVERLGALAIHIGLSIFVLYGIKEGKKAYLLYAILIHAVINFPAALYQKGLINVFVVEVYILLIAVGFIVWIVKSKSLFSSNKI